MARLPLRREAGWWYFGRCRRCGALPLLDRWSCVRWALFAVAVAAFLFIAGLDDGTHPVVALSVHFDAVNLALKTREALAEFFYGEDELDNGAFGAAETLAGHGHRDAGRVGDKHDGSNAAGHLGEADFFGLVAQELLIGLRRGEDGV